MKKHVLLLVVFLIASAGLLAQNRESGAIELIPFFGFSFSNIDGDYVEDLNDRESFNLGAVGDYYFNDRWSIRSGLVYNRMGASIFGLDLNLDYLNIPLNANWHFGSTRKWNLNFGFTPGFLMQAETEGTDLEDFVESFQLCLSFGIGYKLEISEKFSVLFDYQGLYGFTNLNSEGVDTNYNYGSSLNLGAVFAL